MIGTVASHYRITAKLGEGGMGIVYRAEDLRLGRQVALKFVRDDGPADSEGLKRFEREARAASALNHPHICTVFDVGRYEGRPFMVLELLEGTTLSRRIDEGPLPLEEVIRIGVELTDALSAAQEQGIVHRDLKPGNVFLTRGGRAKVLDFGIAKLQGRPADRMTASTNSDTDPAAPECASDAVVGTLAYMSPEQASGSEVDGRSDLFSLGAVLWEAATGQRPFGGASDSEVRDGILNRDPTPGLGLRAALPPPELEPVLLRALEKQPQRRYQSAGEMRADLERLRRRRPRSGGRAAAAGRALRSLDKWPTAAALGLASLLFWRLDDVQRLFQPRRPVTSLVVMPLRSLSADPEQGYLADGMTEALIGQLSQIRSIRVISRTSAMAYKDTTKPIPDIARELGVEGVVEGSVFRSGGRVRVIAQLIRADEERSLWSHTYERELQDLLVLQGELASAIAEEIRVTVTPAEHRRLREAHTVDPEAHHLYLRGRYFWNKRTPEGFDAARRDFAAAIDRDPSSALAWAGLADTYVLLGSAGYDLLSPAEAMPKAKSAALRALELEPRAEIHAALAQIARSYDWNRAAADREFQRALELNPGYATAHQWRSEHWSCFGLHDQAIAEARVALDLDPLSLVLHDNLGWRYYYARRFDLSTDVARRILDMDATFPFAHLLLGMNLVAVGEYGEALAEFEEFRRLSGKSPLALALVGYCRARLGDAAGARAVLKELSLQSVRQYVPAYEFAVVHLGLGEPDETMKWLERAYDERSGVLVLLGVEPLVDSLRRDARFQALLDEVGLPAPSPPPPAPGQ